MDQHYSNSQQNVSNYLRSDKGRNMRRRITDLCDKVDSYLDPDQEEKTPVHRVQVRSFIDKIDNLYDLLSNTIGEIEPDITLEELAGVAEFSMIQQRWLNTHHLYSEYRKRFSL